MIGLALVTDLRERPALAVAAVVTLWSYGVAFVTSRWAVESISFARLTGQRVSWAADASHAREHLLALTRWLPSSVDPRTLNGGKGPVDRRGPEGPSLTGWAVLRGRTTLRAPWNVAMTITGAAAAVTGLLLTGGGAGPAAWTIAVVGGLAALAVAALPRWRPLIAGTGAATLLVAVLAAGAPRPLVVLLPWLAVTVASIHFSGQCLDTMGQLGRVVRGAVVRALTPLARLAVGHRTWQVVASSEPSRG
jgi:hypothetical protein